MAGGVESISCVQNESNRHMIVDTWLQEKMPALYWPMLQTAETVAKRYSIPREKRGRVRRAEPAARRAAAEAGRFRDEIVPITVRMAVADRNSGQMITKEVTLADDEGVAPTPPTRAYRRSVRRCPAA